MTYTNYDRRLNYIHRYGVSECPQHHRTLSKSKEDNRRKFFMHYQKHSEQLVDALKKWGEILNFTSYCEYKDGFLDIEYSRQVEPSGIPFMKQMKKHMQKAYPQILSKSTEIETNHKGLNDKIKEIMTAQYTLSYQKIIDNKMYYSCRKLRASKELDLTQNNIYIRRYIFKIIFETINRKKRSIESLDVSMLSGTSTYQLRHEHYWILAQGGETEMHKLKQALDELVIDTKLEKIVARYYQLRYDITHDDQIENLRNNILQLWEFVHGGQLLGGYPACELCNPPSIDSF